MRFSRTRRAGAVALATAGLCLTTLTTLSAPAANAGSATDLRYDRAEAFVALDPGASTTATATCPADFVAVNGGFHVDSDSVGEAADLSISASYKGSVDTWTATVSNGSDARVTGRVRVTCIAATTVGGQTLTFTGADSGSTSFVDGYVDAATADCPSGVPAGSGWVLNGDAYLIASGLDGGTAWTHAFASAGATTVTSYVYCVGSSASSTVVSLAPDGDVAATTTDIDDGRPADVSSTCLEGAVAVAGTFSELPSGVYALGAESAGRDLRQRFYNDSGDEASVTSDVVCLTSSAPAPALTVTGNDLIESGTGPRTSLAGEVTSSRAGTITGKLFEKIGNAKGARLATGKVKVSTAGGTATLRLKVNANYTGQAQGILVLSGAGVTTTQTVDIS